jgi:hypothetical protein
VPTNRNTLAGPARPLGSPEIPQLFHPASVPKGVFVPHLYGSATVRFADKKRKLDEVRSVAFTVPLEASTKSVDWEGAAPLSVTPVAEPPANAPYLPLPSGAMDVKVFTRWAKRFDRWLARTQRVAVEPRPDAPDVTTLGPKRGGVNVERVAILWVLARPD